MSAASALASVRPALRLARREILRHRWRSLLVLVLVGLPVMASVSVATLIETGSIDSAEARPFTFGASQAQVAWYPPDGSDPSAASESDVRAKLTAATDLPVLEHSWTGTDLVAGDRGWRVAALRTDFSSPLADGLAHVLSGRLPTAADEVALTPDLAHDGPSLGSRVSIGGAEATVVGVATSIDDTSVVSRGVFLPSTSTSPAAGEGGYVGGDLSTGAWTFLVGGPGDTLTSSDRTALEAAGFEVFLPGEASWDSGGPSSEDTQLISLVVVCLLIEIVLLAGPAFAVGVRRQRHALALLAVAGGSPRDLRRTVLAQAVLLGVSGSAIGALTAIPLTWLGLRIAEAGWGSVLGPFDIGWVAVLPAIVLGTLAAVLAAVVPARLAARADVVTALAGRQPTPRVRAGWPLLGAAVLALGTLGCLSSLGRGYGDFSNAWWAVVSVCGAVMMTPWLISTVARLAPRLPLPLRLALRDADRHRSRSAPAVAAVMASVSAVVALGIGSASDDASASDSQQHPYPVGTVTMTAEDAAQMPALVTAVQRQTGVTFTPLHRADGDIVPAQTSGDPAYYTNSIVVADPATLTAWGVRLSPETESALASGKALVDPSVGISAGKLQLQKWGDGEDPVPLAPLPAVSASLAMTGRDSGRPRPILAGVVVSPATARTIGLTTAQMPVDAIADDARAARSSDVRAAAASVSPLGWSINVETQQRSEFWLLLLLLSVLGGFTVLLATFSATGLALDDARHDLATLTAVGARPATRRLVSGTHAFLIAFLGAVLGIAVGFTPGLTASFLLTNDDATGWVLRVPWLLLLLLVVILPIVAGGVTALVSRSRTISLRRAA